MTTLRWPNGVTCPRCHSAEITRTLRRSAAVYTWRCRRCRHYFTVTSDTSLHASKLEPAHWEAAAHALDDSPAGLSLLLGTSAVTARRVSRILRSVDAPPGAGRLAALLAVAPNRRQTSLASPSVDPLASSPESHRRILSALRLRFAGATARVIANDARISVSHARRCLRQLEGEGFVSCQETRIPWGYRHRTIRLWELKLSDRTFDALLRLPRLSNLPAGECGEFVPPEYWWLFWSSTSAEDLRLSNDSLQIAETLIGGPDFRARAWALSNMPLNTLRELRTMRGYDTGPIAEMLDSVVHERADV